MPSHRNALPLIACIVLAVPAFGAGNSFDGTYTGERVLTKGDPAICVAKDPVSVVIHGDVLTATTSEVTNNRITFSPRPDGSFGQISSDQGGRIGSVRGHVGAGVLDADVMKSHCTHHWHLKKEHESQ